MKLQNRKTGFVTDWVIDRNTFQTADGSIKYRSIAELCQDWEDCKELKDYHAWCARIKVR